LNGEVRRSGIASFCCMPSKGLAIAAMWHGALGKPVWLLNRFDTDWRWPNRDDNPWYPTLRLFRQPRPGDWASLICGCKTPYIVWLPAIVISCDPAKLALPKDRGTF
jgi:hypothetical protein